jgi:L-lysine 2,3-aminomutase
MKQMKRIQFYTLQNFRTIPQMAFVSEEIKKDIEVVGRVLPFKTNSYVVNELIDWSRPETDPIFILNFPRKGMLSKKHFSTMLRLIESHADKEEIDQAVKEIRYSLNPNPAGQEHNIPYLGDIKLKGIQHKYPETVLFFPSQGQTCHAYCTFCFRWPQFSGMTGLKFEMKEADLLLKYLKQKKGVSDVLFTGGDPMVMHASILERYILPLLEPEYNHNRCRTGPIVFSTMLIATKLLNCFPKLRPRGKVCRFRRISIIRTNCRQMR